MLTLFGKDATLQAVLQSQSFTPLVAQSAKVISLLQKCRTLSLGYHYYRCSNTDCNTAKYVYHSCRNRHCPQCGIFQQEQWLDDRRTELLPINYYHVVFTIPHELNSMVLGNRKELFKALFQSSAATLAQFAADKKYLDAKLGVLSVLHTWGQNLSFHPHIHCIVSGGGLGIKDGKMAWKNGTRNKDGFLFPVLAMSQVFKAIMISTVRLLLREDLIKVEDKKKTLQLLSFLYDKKWVVYAKQPFNGPEHVIQYLAKYTHRVAISNHRINSVSSTDVNFAYKDYADKNKQKQMTLTKLEFIRRFEQHILPQQFCKIRTYGYLSNRNRTSNVLLISKLLRCPRPQPKVHIPWYIRLLEQSGFTHDTCANCKCQSLQLEHVQMPQQIRDG
jgi:Putative transposase/Transposase zinc-binding domain